MSKLLENGMCLIYLDQCAICALIDSPENSDYSELRELIIAGYQRRKFLCPNSLEHLIETSAMSDDRAIVTDNLLRKISYGWYLIEETRLIARQIFCAMFSMRTTKTQFLQKGLFYPLSTRGTLDELRRLKAAVDSNNAWLMQGFNDLNCILQSGKKADQNILLAIQKHREDTLVKALISAIDFSFFTNRIELFSRKDIPGCLEWTSTICI